MAWFQGFDGRSVLMFTSRDLHVIIQAGDEDPRLFPLTSALSGQAVPKQFAFIAGDGSLLQQTVASYAALVPPERIAVVVSTKYEELARTQLRQWRGIGILARPLDRGPLVDLLLALGRVVARTPEAAVIVAPAYHYVPGGSVLAGSLVAAGLALATSPIIIAGAAMTGVDGGDRIVVPGSGLDGRVLSVRRLVEHAPRAEAKQLKATGALWDTFAFTARAAELWKIVACKLPIRAAIVEHLWAKVLALSDSVGGAFQRMPATIHKGALWQGTKDLGVIPVHGSGWNAWSTPEQVMNSLNDPLDLDRLLSRIYQRQHGITRAQMRRRFRAEARLREVPEREIPL
jgi:mannose-1-phosphate guanylyltransferase